MKKQNILITVPLGATLKNLFMNPDFFDELKKEYGEIHVATTLSEKEIEKLLEPRKQKEINFHFINTSKMSYLQYFFYQATVLSYNKYIKSKTFVIKQKDKSLLLHQKLLLYFMTPLALIITWKRVYNIAEKIKYPLFKNDRIAKLLEDIKPKLVFATAASFHFDFPYIFEAYKKDIPLVGMVHSWDNLSTKGPIFHSFDKVIVWNDFQKDEVLSAYDYPVSNISLIGIPQLDYILQKKKLYNRENLFANLGIDPKRKLITYGTGSPKLIPWEYKIVENIAHALQKSCKHNWHLLVRLHPQDKIERYKNIENIENVSIETVSTKPTLALDGMCFNQDDLIHYGEVLSFSDLIINIASTIGLEAIILNTPVINVAFDDEERNYYQSVARYYDFSHMIYLSSLDAYKTAYNIDDLVSYVNEFLTNRTSQQEERIGASKIINPSMDGKSGIKICNVLREVINA